MIRTFQVVILLTLLGCSTNSLKTRAITIDADDTLKFPVVPSVESEDSSTDADIRLSFTKRLSTDNAIVYTVESPYENKTWGFEISIPARGFAKLSIKSTGVNSDNFLHALQKLYKLELDTTAKFIDQISADCMNMGDYADSLNKKTNGNYVSVSENKVFFQGKGEEDYAELYLDINEAEHRIEFIENDSEYRLAIVRMLTRR